MNQQGSSKIFCGYRALGINSDHVPCVIRYNQKHQETYIITSIGKAFHVYKGSNLGLVRVSDTLESEINALATDEYHIYAAAGNNIYAFKHGRKIVKVFSGHNAPVHQILPFSSQLLSVDTDNEFKVWNADTREVYLTLNFDKSQFEITCMMHPITYINKILFGSKQGTMQLWNMKTSKLIFTFKSFNSPITVMQQTPAVDVVGVGLENGKIFLHNLKYDETIMNFVQEWGPVTSLAFRTDGSPIMISGSNLGHIAVWNLEEKRLLSQIRDAHMSNVCGMHTFHLEPLMVTNSNDNSLKVWIFDMPDGSARLLRQRHGHHLASIKIRFHGENGENILSSGLDSCLMSFSVDHESKNKSLGRASYNKNETRKSGLKLDEHKMPPIVDFASENCKQSDWDSIVCIHQGLRMATTWDYIKSTMGKYKLDNERFSQDENRYSNVMATCCAITSCGNYSLIGYSSGHVDLYNMQSGIFRGTYGSPKAHNSCIRGVATDALNSTTITVSQDGDLCFWQFKNRHFSLKNLNITKLYEKIQLNESVNQIVLHRESSMLAVALDDFSVVIVDCDIKKIVRRFNGHFNKISDMAFSSDARWLLTASMDCMIKVWDLPSSKLIDCILFEDAPISVCLSPTSEFLATTHVNQVGIYLWSNKTLYSHVALKQLDENYVPQQIQLPSTSIAQASGNGSGSQEDDEKMDDDDTYKVYKSPEQLANELVTLSLLPESRWKNLVNLDIIRERNKPREPPKVPKSAPFFLPTVSNVNGFTFENGANTDDTDKAKKKISKLTQINMFLSNFANQLLKAESSSHYDEILNKLKEMGPSAIDVEIRSMSIDMGGSDELLDKFLQFILHVFSTNKNFELASAYLALFLKVHGEALSTNDDLIATLEKIKIVQLKVWNKLKISFNKSLCFINYVKNEV